MCKNKNSSKSCYSRWVKAAATLSDGRETILYYADPPDDEGSYYGVTFNQSDTSFIAFRDAVGNGGNNTLISNVSKEVFSKTKVKEAYNESHKDAQVEYFNDLLTKGDIINVTYGTYDADGTTYTYFRLYNVTKGLLIFEEAVDVGLDVIAENACPLQMEIVEEEQKDGYKQIRFEFESEKGAVVPCYLLIPDTGKEKYPVAIVLQGHNQQGFYSSIGKALCHETLDYDTGRGTFAVQAVKNGYIALAIDQRGMGSRSALNTIERRVSLNPRGDCYYEATTALMLGRTLIGERCWDISRTIDLLGNFKECDLENIVITGNSGGGTASFYAACVDERISVCAPSCSFCPYPESVLRFYHCSCNYIPPAFRYFDMQDLACLIAPRKLAIIAGKYDTAFLIDGVKRGYKTVEKIYEKAGAKDNCRLIVTDKGHWWCEDVVWNAIGEETKKLGW